MNDQTKIPGTPDMDGALVADTTARQTRHAAPTTASTIDPRTLHEKLLDALTPGFEAEFDPEEAVAAGAFAEDALSEQDAVESDFDLADLAVPKPKT